MTAVAGDRSAKGRAALNVIVLANREYFAIVPGMIRNPCASHFAAGAAGRLAPAWPALSTPGRSLRWAPPRAQQRRETCLHDHGHRIDGSCRVDRHRRQPARPLLDVLTHQSVAANRVAFARFGSLVWATVAILFPRVGSTDRLNPRADTSQSACRGLLSRGATSSGTAPALRPRSGGPRARTGDRR